MVGATKAPAALADVIVTCSLCCSLGYMRCKGARGPSCVAGPFCPHSRTTFSSTDSILKTLIGFVIQRGVLVTVVQIALLAVFCTSSSHAYWYVGPEMSIHCTVSANGDTG